MGCLRINNHRYEPKIHIISASVFNEIKKFYISAIPSRSIFPFKSTCRFGFWGYRMKNLLYIVAEVYNKRENKERKKKKRVIVVSKFLMSVVSYAYAVAWLMTGS